MMGYGRAEQTTHGIHQRLWARAYIISKHSSRHNDGEESNGQSISREEAVWIESEWKEDDGRSSKSWFRSLFNWSFLRGSDDDFDRMLLEAEDSICFVSIDLCMGSDILHTRVLERLDQLLDKGSDITQPNLCRLENLSISATHTHSAPGGFLQYALYQIQSLGFNPQVVEILVEGIAQALYKAHRRLVPGSLYLAEGDLFDSNINRSPTSYLLNPQEERDEYSDHGDTDKRMIQLVLEKKSQASFSIEEEKDEDVMGVINWFAVHPTSMNSTNHLISGDNKGYASYLMEKKYNGIHVRIGDEEKQGFIAAFASTNLGDVSPNTAGAKCIDSGEPCDLHTSTCNGRNDLCIASGPGKDMFQSTEIIGRNQFDKAVSLLGEVIKKKNDTKVSSGPVRARHSFVDMTRLNVTLADGSIVQTCRAAIGYAFAAGTTDGHGMFDFKQGSNSTNPFWNMIGGFLSNPSEEQIECQAPKPILLNTGYIRLPYAWDPNIVPLSLFQINNLFIVNVPGEFTTMSGRRLRKALKTILSHAGYEDARVTLAGLSNTYTHYITTYEEYQGQRYEAASTLYGPYTLDAYIQEFSRLLRDLLLDRPSSTSAPPKDTVAKQLSLLSRVEVDLVGVGEHFGAVVEDAHDSYPNTGEESVKVIFRSSNPRTNPRLQDTYLTVETLDDHGKWHVMLTDHDWDTKFIWQGGAEYLGTSFAEIHWDIAPNTPQGIYRICHFGTRRTLFGHTGEIFYRWPEFPTFSHGFNLLASAARAVFGQFRSVQNLFGRRHIQHLKDFHGCSSSFLVFEA